MGMLDYCLNVMTASIVTFDVTAPMGVFKRNSGVDIKQCVQQIVSKNEELKDTTDCGCKTKKQKEGTKIRKSFPLSVGLKKRRTKRKDEGRKSFSLSVGLKKGTKIRKSFPLSVGFIAVHQGSNSEPL